jgi:hypothetical protein
MVMGVEMLGLVCLALLALCFPCVAVTLLLVAIACCFLLLFTCLLLVACGIGVDVDCLLFATPYSAAWFCCAAHLLGATWPTLGGCAPLCTTWIEAGGMHYC